MRPIVEGPPEPADGVERLTAELGAHGYLADPDLAVALHLAERLARPVLLEGPPGVGKTEVARTLARRSGGPLIRLQCHEGIDAGQALYEWDHGRQLLHAQSRSGDDDGDLYAERFLLERPILRAIRHRGPRVLLIDELDRADDEFDALLLEVLDDFGVSVPEWGRFVADPPPTVVITSNRTREIHDAVRRRCLYHWLDHPDPEREAAILRLRAPELEPRLAASVADAVARLRGAGLDKPPGTAEAIAWARALALTGAPEVAGEPARTTLGWVVKTRDDLARAAAALAVGGDPA